MSNSPDPLLPVVHYPESDGAPMAENTVQYRWITLIKENLDRANPDAFVAADLFWYPVQGRADVVRAPDVLVAMGRPKGDRGSYRQWEEGDIAPQVVFEIWSPSNTLADSVQKYTFYDEYRVEEYYLYNPDDGYLAGWLRRDGHLVEVQPMAGHRSPRLGMRFVMGDAGLHLEHADGRPFLSYEQVAVLLDAALLRADQEKLRADQEQQRADQERQRAANLEARLRALGVDPDVP
jgi:Uma2 family endonuclease